MAPVTAALALSLWFTLACNGLLWHGMWTQLAGASLLHRALFISASALLLTAAQAALLALFAWPSVFRLVATIAILAAAGAAAFMHQYGVVIDRSMMINVYQTDVREAEGLASWTLIAQFALFAIPPLAVLYWVRWKQEPWRRRLAHNAMVLAGGLAVTLLVLGLAYKDMSALMRNDRTLRYRVTPASEFISAVRALIPEESVGPLLPLGRDARVAGFAPGDRPRLLVLVVGETARADHFSTNGYPRPTAPELAAPGVLNYPDAHSCGTNTAASVPCMFSVLGKQRFEGTRARYENLLDILQRAGYRVLWLDNQSGCKGQCERVAHEDVSHDTVPGLCSREGCYDDILLHGLDDRLARLARPGSPGVVLVLHQIGSHGPEYWLRSPPDLKPFGPECHSANLGSCSNEEIVNAFDNSIHYTSHMLGSALQWLQAQAPRYDTALIYMSDHGESLGENGLYLHGMPYALAPEVQKHVPMIVWLSPGMARRDGIDLACMRMHTAEPMTHDNWSQSTLGLLDVSTTVYREALDIFAPCRGRSAP